MSTATINDFDTVTLCAFCGHEPIGKRGCCGESSMHFEEHYVVYSENGKSWEPVNPATGEVLNETCELSRKERY